MDTQYFIAKARALFHDPPNKAFVLREHEKVAEELRKKVLTGIFSGLQRRWEEVVKLADFYASSFDRWILGSTRTDVVVKYYGLLNVIDPRYSTSVTEPPADAITKFAEKLSGLLNSLNDKLSKRETNDEVEKVRLLYSALYVSLEPLWLLSGGVLSPADTRAPTHSVFDHLYASAAMVNLLTEETPAGYLVRIDIPGVQGIVNAARKAGDFWAGSWLLSNLLWETVKHFIKTYGPDVLLSPSPRLNPYVLLEVVNELNAREEFKEVCKFYLALIGVKDCENCCYELEKRVEVVPLLPATATLILPPTQKDIREEVKEAYKNAWKVLIDRVENILKDKVSKVESKKYEVALALLEKYRSEFECPPSGVRIDIVEVRKIYEDLKSCFNGNEESCKKLGIKHEEQSEDLARRLLWHVAMTKGFEISLKTSQIPMPKVEWYLEGDELRKVGEKNWRVCSLDGEERAIVYIGKSVKEGFEDYVKEDFENFVEKVGVKLEDKMTLRVLLRPGEALGPYCLFKRLTYVAYSDRLREVLNFESTDDVMLSKYSNSLKIIRRDLIDKLVNKISAKIGKNKEVINGVISWLFGTGKGKDICGAAEVILQISCDKLIRVIDEAIKELKEEEKEKFEIEAKRFAKDLLGEYPKINELIEKSKDLSSLFKFRDSYAIIKADADNMGKLLSGDLSALSLSIDKYVMSIIKEIERNGKIIKGDKELEGEERRRALDELKRSAEENLKALGKEGNNIIISPTYSQLISASLMISSLRDLQIILNHYGFPIFTGGDDLLALTPVETAIFIALATRSSFHGENMFHYVEIDGRKVLLSPALPTGRSYSLRFASLKDVMAEEILNAIEILEEEAKETKWKGIAVCDKDTLVISESRGGLITLFPLSLRVYKGDEDIVNVDITDDLLTAITPVLWGSLIGLISRGTGTDLRGELMEILQSGISFDIRRGLSKMVRKVIKRNSRNEEIMNWISEEVLCNLKGVEIIDSKGYPLAYHIFNLIDVIRGYI